MGGRRHVARGVPGGYRIRDNRRRGRWGDFYEVCPDDLLPEPNGAGDRERITGLMRHYRALKR